MKHLKSINEGFKLVDLNNSKWYGSAPDEKYNKKVHDKCLNIMMEELQVSEKSFDMIVV